MNTLKDKKQDLYLVVKLIELTEKGEIIWREGLPEEDCGDRYNKFVNPHTTKIGEIEFCVASTNKGIDKDRDFLFDIGILKEGTYFEDGNSAKILASRSTLNKRRSYRLSPCEILYYIASNSVVRKERTENRDHHYTNTGEVLEELLTNLK